MYSRLYFKTKTKTKTLHLKSKTFLWCILEADRKAFFIFGRKWKCRQKWNSIYGRKRNKNKHSFSAEKWKRKSPDNISVFFSFSYIQSPSQPPQCAANTSSSFAFLQVGLVDRIPLSSCTVYTYFCGLFSRWNFNPWTVCFPGLLLPSESNFSQSMHYALLASVWPNK